VTRKDKIEMALQRILDAKPLQITGGSLERYKEAVRQDLRIAASAWKIMGDEPPTTTSEGK